MSNYGSHLNRRSVHALLLAAAAWMWEGKPLQLVPTQHEHPNNSFISLFENPCRAIAIGAACLKLLPPKQRTHHALACSVVGSTDVNAPTIEGRDALRRSIMN